MSDLTGLGNRKVSRRGFLRGAAGVGAFSIVPRYVLGGAGFVAPSDKINIAMIGTGGQGIVKMKGMLGHEDVNIISLCDVNQESDYSHTYFGGKAGLAPASRVLEAHNAKKNPKGGRKFSTYGDFRLMLEKEKGIDAVIVATPDHVHAVATMASLKMGKHVYCEKPLTHTIFEAREIAAAAREAKVATQMGNQGHSGEGIRLTVEWIRDGAIGDIREVHSWTQGGRRSWTKLEARPTEKMSVPKGFNWDRWLGPVQKRAYHSDYAPYMWRGWWEFGTAAIGDMGCHNMDPAIWALNLGHPKSVEASSTEVNSETVTEASMVTYKYDARGDMPPVKMTWYDGGMMPIRPDDFGDDRRIGGNGILFVGEKGNILCGGCGATPRIIPEAKMKAYKRPAKVLARTKGHHRDWLDACKGGKEACSNFEVGSHLTELVLLGGIAIRRGKKLYWDGANMRFTNDEKANEYVKVPYREGWTL